MAINVSPEDQLNSMTNNPPVSTTVPDFMPVVGAEAANVLGFDSAMPKVEPQKTPPDILSQLGEAYKKLPNMTRLPSWDPKKNFTSNYSSLVATAQSQMDQYQQIRKTLAGLNQMRLDEARNHFETQQARMKLFYEQSAEHIRQSTARAQQLRDMKIDPSRYFRNKGTWASILGLMSVATTSVNMARMGMDPNQALVGITNAINQDIEAQKLEIGLAKDYNKTMDQLGVRELDLLVKGINLERVMFADKAGFVINELKELSNSVDNSMTKNLSINLVKDFAKHAVKEDYKKSNALVGAMDMLGNKKAHAARNNIIKNRNMEALENNEYQYYQYSIEEATQEAKDPMNQLRATGQMPEVIVDPVTGRPVPNQEIAKQRMRQHYNTEVQLNNYAQAKAQGRDKEAKEFINNQSIEDFNVYGGGGLPKHSLADAVINVNGQRVYFPKGSSSAERILKRKRIEGTREGLVGTGKMIAIAEGLERRINSKQLSPEKLKVVMQRLGFKDKRDFLNADIDERASKFFNKSFWEKIKETPELVLASLGLRSPLSQKDVDSVLVDIKAMQTQARLMIGTLVPITSAEDPVIRAVEPDIERAERLAGIDYIGALMFFAKDPTAALDRFKKGNSIVSDHFFRRYNEQVSGLSTEAMREASTINYSALNTSEQRLKQIDAMSQYTGALHTGIGFADDYLYNTNVTGGVPLNAPR